jgi:hypothetical protein
VTFQVVFPDPTHPPFLGPPHKTTPDGAVQTMYRTNGNPNGTYTVKATGDMGTTGENTFVIGPAGAATTTATTRPATTTPKATTSTTFRGA